MPNKKKTPPTLLDKVLAKALVYSIEFGILLGVIWMILKLWFSILGFF